MVHNDYGKLIKKIVGEGEKAVRVWKGRKLNWKTEISVILVYKC